MIYTLFLVSTFLTSLSIKTETQNVKQNIIQNNLNTGLQQAQNPIAKEAFTPEIPQGPGHGGTAATEVGLHATEEGRKECKQYYVRWYFWNSCPTVTKEERKRKVESGKGGYKAPCMGIDNAVGEWYYASWDCSTKDEKWKSHWEQNTVFTAQNDGFPYHLASDSSHNFPDHCEFFIGGTGFNGCPGMSLRFAMLIGQCGANPSVSCIMKAAGFSPGKGDIINVFMVCRDQVYDCMPYQHNCGTLSNNPMHKFDSCKWIDRQLSMNGITNQPLIAAVCLMALFGIGVYFIRNKKSMNGIQSQYSTLYQQIGTENIEDLNVV